MCQGQEDAFNPQEGTSHSQDGGGATQPPSPPWSQSPASARSECDQEEEELWEDMLHYENYLDSSEDYGHLLSQISPDLSAENDNNSGGSDGEELGDKDLIEALFRDFDKGHDIFRKKILLLSDNYKFFRRVARDGSCFYRAFIFSYLEHVLDIRDDYEPKSEVKHLKRCVEKAKQASYESLSSPIPKGIFAAFHYVVDLHAFEYVVDLIQGGLFAEQLYFLDKEDKVISKILPFIRLLTEIELCTREDFYKKFLAEGEYESVREFCQHEVSCAKSEANHLQITALVNALGVPLIIENLDISMIGGVVQLNQHTFCPRAQADVNLASLNLHCSHGWSESAEDVGGRAIADLSPAERWRLVTLLYRPGHYDILYPKEMYPLSMWCSILERYT